MLLFGTKAKRVTYGNLSKPTRRQNSALHVDMERWGRPQVLSCQPAASCDLVTGPISTSQAHVAQFTISAAKTTKSSIMSSFSKIKSKMAGLKAWWGKRLSWVRLGPELRTLEPNVHMHMRFAVAFCQCSSLARPTNSGNSCAARVD
jgi:hypothetical protein